MTRVVIDTDDELEFVHGVKNFAIALQEEEGVCLPERHRTGGLQPRLKTLWEYASLNNKVLVLELRDREDEEWLR